MAGFFFDNGYRGQFEFGEAEEYLVHFQGGQYTEYIFAGPAMRDILQAYTSLTGRMAPPPMWALGYHQCRWHPYTQPEVERLARRLRDTQSPATRSGWTSTTWTATACSPGTRNASPIRRDARRLCAEGFRVGDDHRSGGEIRAGLPVFDEAMRRDVLCKTEAGAVYLGQVWPGKTAFPDFVTAEGRKWWGELNAEHVRAVSRASGTT